MPLLATAEALLILIKILIKLERLGIIRPRLLSSPLLDLLGESSTFRLGHQLWLLRVLVQQQQSLLRSGRVVVTALGVVIGQVTLDLVMTAATRFQQSKSHESVTS